MIAMDEAGVAGSARDFDVAKYVAMAHQLSDEELEAGFASNRRRLLEQIFARMADYFDAVAAGNLDTVVEWRILGGASHMDDIFHMIIREGTCRTRSGPHADPAVTITLGPVPFIRIITGKANPIRLFTYGKLAVHGNLVLAAKVSRLFQIPSPA